VTEQTGEEVQTGRLSVNLVRPLDVPQVWPHVVDKIRRGLKFAAGDRITETGLLKALLDARFEMWVFRDGTELLSVAILQVVERPRGKAIIIIATAGRNFHRCAPEAYKLFRKYKQLIGAYTVEAVARDGMAKWLARDGWKRKATIMEMV